MTRAGARPCHACFGPAPLGYIRDVASSTLRSWPFHWLVVPAVVGLLVILGLAVSAEGRDDFEDSLADRPQQQNQPDDDTGPAESPSADGQPLDGTSDRPDLDDPTSRPGGGGDLDQDGDAIGGRDAGRQDGAGDSFDQGGDSAYDGDGRESNESGELGEAEELSFEVLADDGSVGIRLAPDPETPAVAIPRGGDGRPGTRRTLDPRPDQEGNLLRLNPQGDLEAAGGGDIRPGQLVLQPSSGGVDVVRADGTRIEFRVEDSSGTGDADGNGLADTLTINDIDTNGNATPISPDDNGRIEVGDGVTIQLRTESEPSTLWERATTTPWRWFVLAIALLVLASLSVAYYLHRTRPGDPFGQEFVAPGGVPADRFEDFLAMLLADDDPARAVRLAFEAAERGMGTLPSRHTTETPFEWYSRVVADQEVFAAALNSLCSRFATARFAPDRPTSADRDAAVAELRSVAVLAGYRPADSPVMAEPVRVGR